MRDRRVLGLISSILAALPAPSIFHSQVSQTARICLRCNSSRVYPVSVVALDRLSGIAIMLCWPLPGLLSMRVDPGEIMIERSTIFSSSRILPGQSYATRSSITCWGMRVIFLPSRALMRSLFVEVVKINNYRMLREMQPIGGVLAQLLLL